VEDNDLAVAGEAHVELRREAERACLRDRGERVLGPAVLRRVQPTVGDRRSQQPAVAEVGGLGRSAAIVAARADENVNASSSRNCSLAGSTLVYESRGRRRGPTGKEDAVPEVTRRSRDGAHNRSHRSRGGRA